MHVDVHAYRQLSVIEMSLSRKTTDNRINEPPNSLHVCAIQLISSSLYLAIIPYIL